AACALQENQWKGNTSIEFIASHVRSHQPLAYPGVNGEAPTRIHRGPGKNGRLVTSLEIDASQPMAAARQLHDLVKSGEPLRFNLTGDALEEAEKAARALPALPELRVALRFARAGRPAPLEPGALAFCHQVLREVGLLDEHGNPIKGNGQHPYRSDSLQAALAEQYRLLEFIKAYRTVNDASFEIAVLTLFN